MSKRLLRLREIAVEYNIKEDMVRMWIDKEGLPKLKNTRTVMIREVDLDEFIEKNLC